MRSLFEIYMPEMCLHCCVLIVFLRLSRLILNILLLLLLLVGVVLVILSIVDLVCIIFSHLAHNSRLDWNRYAVLLLKNRLVEAKLR
jgi:hypothetical protein